MMRKNFWGGVVLSFTLTACGSMNRTIEPEHILPNPKDRTPLPSAYLESGKVNCILTAVTADGSIPAEIEQFSQAMYCAYTTMGSGSTAWIQRFVEKGITLSDQTCGLFFDSLEKRRVDTSYYQTNMNVAGTAVTAILVGAGHNARSAFNVATALAMGNAWFENYKANYVFTPQLGKLHIKLKNEVRKPIGDEMKRLASSNQYGSFDNAKADLQSYDELCSHKSIVYLLDEALSAAKIETFNSRPTEQDTKQADTLTGQLHDIAAKGGPPFEDGVREQLYVVATTQGTERRKLVAAYVSTLDDKIKAYIDALKLSQDAPDTVGVALVLSIGQFLRYGDSGVVRSLRFQVDKAIDSRLNDKKSVGVTTLAAADMAPTTAEITSWSAIKAEATKAAMPPAGGVNFNFRALRIQGQ